jgi:exopolyphosphatase/guanosine-5'-triphosphate,3'-diphosphate pyrophosphatase
VTHRVAAVDCGTNSLRLLVVDLEPQTGAAHDVDRRTTIVRLGQDVDRTGEFAPEALRRTFATLDEYARLVEGYDVDLVRFVATSAARDVRNRDEFADGVVSRLGIAPDIITGEEEAALSYDGATRGLVEHLGVPEPVMVVDIGGGSTEFVLRPLGSRDAGAAEEAGEHPPVVGRSLDIGSVRMTERHLHDDPPTEPQVREAVRDIESVIAAAGLPFDQAATLVGVAGTVTTMAAMVLGLSTYDPTVIHHARLRSADVLSAVDRMVHLNVRERRGLDYLDPGRADVIGAGALVLGCVLRASGAGELVVSEHDILDGIAWSLV